MLTLDQTMQVNRYLNHAMSFVSSIGIPHDYASILNIILQLELKKEIELIRKAIQNPKSFEVWFKNRCQERESLNIAIPFSVIPDTVTNKLYYDIAMTVFVPKTQTDLLAIIMPSVKYQLKVEIPETLPISKKHQELREFLHESLNPSFEKYPYVDNSKPRFDLLNTIVAEMDYVFSVDEIAKLPLFLHEKIHAILYKYYPSFAKKLYGHNSALRTLENDIETIQRNGTTPEVAIKRLISGFIVGGERMTGGKYAGKSAQDALDQFMAYYNHLPDTIKDELNLLKGSNKTLGSIVDNNISKGHCVETVSTYLTEILQANSKNQILTKAPALTKEGKINLEKKYRQKLPTNNEFVILPSLLPEDLLLQSLVKIKPSNMEELVVLTLNFPLKFYDFLLRQADFRKINSILEKFETIIKTIIVNEEQKIALLNAIILNFNKLKKPSDNPLLLWLLALQEPKLIQECLNSLSDKRTFISEITAKDSSEKMVLYELAEKHPDFLKIILNSISEEIRVSIFDAEDADGNTLIHKASCDPKSLEIILSYIPEPMRLDAIKKANKNGITALHIGARNNASLRCLLNLYPNDDARLRAIKTTDNAGYSVLHFSATNTNSFETLLDLYPGEISRAEAIQMKTLNERSVLDVLVDHLDFINYQFNSSSSSLIKKLPKIAHANVIRSLVNYCCDDAKGKIQEISNLFFKYKSNSSHSTCIKVVDHRKEALIEKINAHLNGYDTYFNLSVLQVKKILTLLELIWRLSNSTKEMTITSIYKEWKSDGCSYSLNQTNFELISEKENGLLSLFQQRDSSMFLEKIMPVDLTLTKKH